MPLTPRPLRQENPAADNAVGRELEVIFSPSDTKDWDRCPLYRELKREGWEPRGARWEPNKLLGTAIGDGLSESYRHWTDPNPSQFGLSIVTQRLTDGYVENPAWTLEALKKLALRGFNKALSESAIPQGALIIRVDETVGVGRPDLVLRNLRGQLEVWDTKVSLALDPRYVKSRISEYETDHQVWHSAWTVSEHFGETVAISGIQQIVLTPRTLYDPYTVTITESRLQFWLSGAESIWQAMEEERQGKRPVVPRFSSCQSKYGRCIYHDWCHLFGGDPEKSAAYYAKDGE